MTSFRYEPLATLSTIRLVLLPATDGLKGDEKLQLILGHGEISKVRKRYCALSYVWGSEDRIHTISLNGQNFRVTDNLMFFLRRKRAEPVVFWIDAICINQDDSDEKSKQIPRMREIYKNASSVYAELGPASEDVQSVFRKMELLSNQVRVEIDRTLLEKDPIAKFRLPPEFFESYDSHMWEGLEKILDNPWWKRVWVMQEATAISSENTYILYANAEVSLWHTLICGTAFEIFRYQRPWREEPERRPLDVVIRRIWLLLYLQGNELVIHFLGVLEILQGLLATDPRDIIYAALNIANDVVDIRPDYEKTVPNVYRDVAVHYLSDAVEPLRILSYCGTSPQNPEFEPGWASWVPSWQYRHPRHTLRNTVRAKDGSEHLAYNPCGREGFPLRVYPIEIDGNALTVYGFQIDTLSTVSRPCVSSSLREVIEIVTGWMPKDLAALYRTGETMLDTFLRTVVADITDPWNDSQRGGKANLELGIDKSIGGDSGREDDNVFYFPRYRCLAYSLKGYMALVSHQAREGDILYVLFGGSLLYLLRPKGDKFILVGDCYVHGLMDGEATQILDSRQAVVERITII